MELSRIYAVALRRLRERKAWSQTELGDRVGLTKSTISKLETGKQTLDAATLSRCLHVSGVTLSAFHRLCETIEQEGKVLHGDEGTAPANERVAPVLESGDGDRLLILHQDVGAVPGSRLKLEVDLYLRPF